jgi:AcrR family transcriptional regulator
VFAAEGCRCAGAGTGTVSRHFPTREDLFAAIPLDRVARLAGQAAALADRVITVVCEGLRAPARR